jgi:hypothetical protein
MLMRIRGERIGFYIFARLHEHSMSFSAIYAATAPGKAESAQVGVWEAFPHFPLGSADILWRSAARHPLGNGNRVLDIVLWRRFLLLWRSGRAVFTRSCQSSARSVDLFGLEAATIAVFKAWARR